MNMSTTVLPNNIIELKDYLSGKTTMTIEYRQLCKLWETNQSLIFEYFSDLKLAGQHCAFAAHLYAIYGIEVYKSIYNILISNNVDKENTLWDEFMLSQVEKLARICYEQNYQTYFNGHYAGYNFSKKNFFSDLEQICDNDLYIEMMCKIVRTSDFWTHEETTSSDFEYRESNYVIDYEFLQRRMKTLSKNIAGMRRYVNLVNYLVPYDYLGAFKAWGDFYYYFEEVYESKPPKSATFTGKLYDAFFYTSDFQTNNSTIIAYIKEYGWKYLHHAFEINTSADWCLNRIYDNLPPEDKIKADEAKRNYYATRMVNERETKTQDRIKQNGLPTDEEIEELKAIFIKDHNAGMMAWKNIIHILSSTKKVSKDKLRRNMDKVLIDVYNQLYSNKLFTISKVYKAPLLKYQMPTICFSILEDQWLTEFYFKNFQSYTVAGATASILLIQNETVKLETVLQYARVNGNINIGKFIDNIFLHANNGLNYMRDYISNTKEFFSDSDNGKKVTYEDESIYNQYYRFSPSYEKIMYFLNLESELDWKSEFLLKCRDIEKQINYTLGRLSRLEEDIVNA